MTLLHSSFQQKNGVLYFGGENTVALAEKYGTPLYVYDANRVLENIVRIKQAFKKYYEPFRVLYAVKANNHPDILKIIQKHADGADASYSTEIQRAADAGLSKEAISFSGNYLSLEELAYGVKHAGTINCDSVRAFEKILAFGRPKKLAFRINPGIGKGKFASLAFAGKRAKFGIRHEDAVSAYALAQKVGVEHLGIYMMTGSCILDPLYFETITERLLAIAGHIKKTLGIRFEWVNIGGGFGIPYRPGEKPLNIENVARRVATTFQRQCKKYGLGTPELVIEPGRYILGDAGILLTRIHEIKKSYMFFAGTDAGMNVLLRPALYGAYHHVLLANRMNAKPLQKITLTGQICENTDILAKNRLMPELREGDTLAVLCAGAYGFSMSSSYNTRPLPKEVIINPS